MIKLIGLWISLFALSTNCIASETIAALNGVPGPERILSADELTKLFATGNVHNY